MENPIDEGYVSLAVEASHDVGRGFEIIGVEYEGCGHRRKEFKDIKEI